MLGHAVALTEGDADALIPVEQGTRNRRRAADQNARAIQPQPFANLARHQAADQRNAQQARQLGLRYFLQHALLKARPQPRHGEEHSRPYMAQIAGKGLQRLDKAHSPAAVQRIHLHQKPLGGMRQRQVGEKLILLGNLQLLDRAPAGNGKGLGREHHALGLAGGAGGIEDAQQFIWRMRVASAQRLMRRQQRMPAVRGLDGRVWHGDTDDLGRDARFELARFVQLAKEDRLALRMAQHVLDTLGRLQRVQRHADQPGEHDRQIGNDPLGAVFRQQRHPLTGHAAQRVQGRGHTPCLLIHLGPGEVMPLAVHRLAKPDRIRTLLNPERQALQRQLIGHRNPSFLLFCRGER